jgi:hypothetical protein
MLGLVSWSWLFMHRTPAMGRRVGRPGSVLYTMARSLQFAGGQEATFGRSCRGRRSARR